MWLILLEAGVAMFVLVFIVWWTMFAGRKPEGSRQNSSSRPQAKTNAGLHDPAPPKDR
jgi:hypothetical protein